MVNDLCMRISEEMDGFDDPVKLGIAIDLIVNQYLFYKLGTIVAVVTLVRYIYRCKEKSEVVVTVTLALLEHFTELMLYYRKLMLGKSDLKYNNLRIRKTLKGTAVCGLCDIASDDRIIRTYSCKRVHRFQTLVQAY